MALSSLHPTANQKHPEDLWSAVGSALKSQALASPVVPVPRTGPAPLSQAQERLYFVMSGADGNYYQVYLAWRVTGPLNTAALERSLNAIVERHEILRTSFPVAGSFPVAVIAGQANLSLQVVDLRMLAEEEREREALQRACEEVRRPFDLTRGPLLRASLFRLADEQHLLVVTICQIVFDGWSMRVFSRELGALYTAFAEGRSPSLPELPVQWLDFVYWQRNSTQGSSLEAERSYWRSQLEAPYVPLQLPIDHPRSSGQTPAGSKQSWMLPRDLTEQLNSLAQQENATHFSALLAALQAWLHCLTGQQDIIIFASTFARGRPETRGLIGLFANVLPLRTGFSGSPTFREVLRRVRDVSLGAFVHQSLPFETILEMLSPVADAQHNPLFQVMLIHQNAPLPMLTAGDVTFNPTDEIDSGTAKFDFLWDVAETRQGLKGTFTYRSDLFDAATIATLLGDFKTFVAGLVAAPDRPVAELSQAMKSKACCSAPLNSHFRVTKPGESFTAPQANPSRGATERAFVAPRNCLEEQLAALWEKHFGRAPIGIEDNFFDLGGHSLLAVQLFAGMEQFIGRRLPLATLFAAPTIEKLVRVVRQEGWTPPYTSLVPIRPAGSRPPVYCISGVGGTVFLFHNLARHLDEDQPVYGLQPPDLDGKHSALTRVEDIAAHYIREMRAIQPEGPYYLIGFSFGGLVAFEMAQQLLEQNQRVGLLALFDAYQTGFVNELSATTRFRQRLRTYRIHLEEVLHGPEGLDYLKKVLKGKGLKILYRFYKLIGRPVPPALAAVGTMEDLQVFARSHYSPRVYPGRATLFRSRIRPEFEMFDYEMGWGKVAGGGVEVHEVPGDHHTMCVEPNVRSLAATFAACLERAQSEKQHQMTTR